MKSFTNLRNLYGTLTNDNSTTNLTVGDQLINDSYRRTVAERDWPFVQKTATSVTMKTLAYDAQTGNFTLGLTITGGTSGATAVIVKDTDSGTTGTLTLKTISGTFSDNEIITDTSTGSATVNGTLTSVQFYDLPFDYDELISTNITVGTQIFTSRECPTRKYWDQLNSVTSWTSDYPEWFFIFNGQIGFYPTPSSADNTITFVYDRLIADLSMADYTTGNVSAVTNGSQLVTGSGTSWTTPMAGRWIKITPTDTAGSTGDGFWYQILSVTSTTALILSKPYQGSTISGNTAYTIGQMGILPEAYEDIPVYEAAATYFMSIKPEPARYQMFYQIYDRLHKGLIADYSMKTIDPKIEDGDDYNFINPNLFIYGS